MPPSTYTALRKECTKEFGAAEFSGNDLICALIFRSLIRASASLNVRETNGTAPKVASLSLPFDRPPKLLQSMDTLYLGNMNFENRLTVPVEVLIASTTSIHGLPRLSMRMPRTLPTQVHFWLPMTWCGLLRNMTIIMDCAQRECHQHLPLLG
jgi:hypothetical protein